MEKSSGSVLCCSTAGDIFEWLLEYILNQEKDYSHWRV